MTDAVEPCMAYVAHADGVQNKFYVTMDWCRTKVFGRDTGGESDFLTAASLLTVTRQT